jgi:hypothetical protein
MTTVDDMSTTRKAAHDKGSRPRNQENVHNQEERTPSHRQERAQRGRSGSLAGLRLCMVMHVGNSGGSRAWQRLLGRRPDWGIGPPRSTGVRKGSACEDRQCGGPLITSCRWPIGAHSHSRCVEAAHQGYAGGPSETCR